MRMPNAPTTRDRDETFGRLVLSALAGAVRLELDDLAPVRQWLARTLRAVVLTPQTVALCGFGIGALLAIAFLPETGSAGWLAAAEHALGVNRGQAGTHPPIATPVTTPARHASSPLGSATMPSDSPLGSRSATTGTSLPPRTHQGQTTRGAAPLRLVPRPTASGQAPASTPASVPPSSTVPSAVPPSSPPSTAAVPASRGSDAGGDTSQSSNSGRSDSAGASSGSASSGGGGQVGVNVDAGPVNVHVGL